SRATLALLQERGIDPEIILYLETPPGTRELADICSMLAIPPRELLRKGEAEYTELGLDSPALSDSQLLQAMHTHPRLIERPIVLNHGKAAIGRPPEAVLAIL
ncbi:MAG TPA: arsenate reductase (glutaredoxin), partial [Xanthomonadales bacterium]|nr:arsenate reductase (glutaredoxin) [Xanthomonadales bacterium]